MYHKNNFHKYTFCVFQEVSLEDIEGLTLHYTSKSGSSYYVTKEGVYRKSNHWGRVANCRWRLKTLANDQISKTKVGYAKWADFYRDNESETLYFIEIESLENQEIYLQHKDHPSYTSQILRTGKETAKRIKTINEVLSSDQWAKYLDVDNLELTRKRVVEQLLDTNLSFQEIRRNLY
ncbi:MAG: hypothetical protein H6584_04155 [Flavobacteriales bacterium]|nr:hypothetical protein [Flavobacteriales bacterium]